MARTNERARAPAIGNAIFAVTGTRLRPGQYAAGARAKEVIGGSYFRSSSTTTGSGLG
jgi:hypothetical protein